MKHLLTLISLLSFSVAAFAQDKEQDFREFTGANGKKITALLIDKTENEVTMRMKNGREMKFPIEKLSEADQEYVKAFDPAKDIFLKKCSTMSVRELLQLRGYESFEFRIQFNHILVDGELNGKKSRFLIDTGAGGTTLHVDAAKKAGCEVGPMDQIIYGVGGEAPAAWTKVPSIRLGEALITDQKLLSADLFIDAQGPKSHDAIFGADFLHQLYAVIDYTENRIFLRPDLANGAKEEDKVDDELPEFQLFKVRGKVYRGNVVSKTNTAFKIKPINGGKEIQLPISSLNEEDQKYVKEWSIEKDTFMRKCRSLAVEDILELRKYQSHEYRRQGNHIFVDGKLNGKERLFMIDTGASTSVLHFEDAQETGCEVGPFDRKVIGIGGEAPAAVTKVPSIEIGKAKAENRSLLSIDLFKSGEVKRPRGNYGAIFGADFLREMNGVINYRESRLFLRP